MTPERIEQAQAPWVTWTPDTDQPATVLRTLAEQGELDGTVGIWAAERDEAVVEDVVNPVLEELGVEAVETAIAVAPADDPAAQAAETATIAERFDASGVDTLVLVGESAQGWPTNMVDNPYRPQLLFLDTNAPTGVLHQRGHDGHLDPRGLAHRRRLRPRPGPLRRGDHAGVHPDAGRCRASRRPTPSEVGDDPSNQPYQAAFQACPDVYLLRALLEAAGEDLNYGTLEAAIDGLELALPGDPEPLTFGPPPDADGNPTAYLFEWDEEAGNLVPQEG